MPTLLLRLSNGQVFTGEFREIHPDDTETVMRSYTPPTGRPLQGYSVEVTRPVIRTLNTPAKPHSHGRRDDCTSRWCSPED